MNKHFFIMQCKSGCELEYAKRHQAVFPDLLESISRVGITNYNIFLDGTKIYAYLETDDFQKSMEALGQDPANQRWQKYMGDIMETDENGDVVVKVIDNLVFSHK